MSKQKSAFPEPLEAQEQRELFQWAAMQAGKYPELRFMYHVPNGGKRNAKEAALMKAEGVKAGVPDIVLPTARGAFHGLYIELKRQKSGRLSEDQKQYLAHLQRQGYSAVMCRGWRHAASVILMYLESKREDESCKEDS